MRPILACLLLLAPATAAAQFDVTLLAGASTHGAHADDPSTPDHPGFAPSSSRALLAAVGYRRGAFRIAVSVRTERPDLVLRGDDAGVITPDALRLVVVALSAGRRILGDAGRAELAVEAGVARSRWSFRGFDDPPSAGWSAQAALEAALPFASHWAGILRLDGGIGGSMFPDEPIEGYRSRTPLRATLSVGLRLAP